MTPQQNSQSGLGAIFVEALALASPPIAYAIASHIAGEPEEFVVSLATGTAVVATILVAIGCSWVATRRAPRALLLLLVIFVPNALLPADASVIKMAQTINLLFAVAIVLWGASSRQPFLKTVLGEILPLPRRTWRILTRVCLGGYVGLALMNELIWRTQSDDTWVLVRNLAQPLLVYGCLAFLLAISIWSSLRIAPRSRLSPGDLDARRAVWVDRWMVLSSYNGLHIAPIAVGCLVAYLLREISRSPGPIQQIGACVIVALSAHAIICWRHRGVGSGMYSKVAALFTFAGAITSGILFYLLIERHGTDWTGDRLLAFCVVALSAYAFIAPISLLVWGAGRRRGSRRNVHSAGAPATIYAAFERGLQARFRTAKSGIVFRRSYIAAAAVLVLGWICLLGPLANPARPAGALRILMTYSGIMGGVLLFFASHVASRSSSRELQAPQKTALLLRPFKEDTDSTGLFAPSFETHLAKLLSPHLALTAIKSLDHMETFGASHVAYSHEVWQTEALRMMREAELVVLSLGDSPGVRWEIETVLSERVHDKTVFVVPEPSADQTDWWPRLTRGFANTKWSSAIDGLSDIAHSVRAFTVYPDGSVRVVHVGEQSHRSRTLGVVLAASSLASAGTAEPGGVCP
jgi:intracellular septation protein A